MSDVFGTEYARQYDALYQDKDYDAEVELLVRIFGENELPAPHRVLDLGCGTGAHAIRLAQRGYLVTGVDRSAAMLSIARAKAEQALDTLAPHPSFVEGDVTTVRVDGAPFDSVLMMFAVLGYQLSDDAVSAALATVRAHLRDGGVFVCDVWYGPAVLSVRPSERTKVVRTPDGQVIRSAQTSLDIDAHRADVQYRLTRLRGLDVVAESSETHRMRFFFPEEIGPLFDSAGLQLLELRAFRADGVVAPPSDKTWNVLAVSRAV